MKVLIIRLIYIFTKKGIILTIEIIFKAIFYIKSKKLLDKRKLYTLYRL